jgi:hypothetical protein
MRETIVVELFAHDLVSLADAAVRAPRETIDAIDVAARRSDAEPPRDRLILAAIEALTGSRPDRAPPRDRSPILEMPETLRYAAHRNSSRDTLAKCLDLVRHRRRTWGFVVVEAVDTPFYVQFASYPGPGMRAETVGQAHLPDPIRLGAAARATLASLGWSVPRDDSDGNWTRAFRSPGREDLSAVAEFALETLERAYRCGPGMQYRVDVGAWGDAQIHHDEGASRSG